MKRRGAECAEEMLLVELRALNDSAFLRSRSYVVFVNPAWSGIQLLVENFGRHLEVQNSQLGQAILIVGDASKDLSLERLRGLAAIVFERISPRKNTYPQRPIMFLMFG